MALSLKVEVKGDLAGKIARLIEASQQVEARASAIVRESAFVVTVGAKNLVPVSTGMLFASINPTFFNNGLSAIIGSFLPYAARQEFDSTLNHRVRPSRVRKVNTTSGRKGTIIKGTAQTNPQATWGFLRKSLAQEKDNFLTQLRLLVDGIGGAWAS